ncbi:MAG: phage holin family protein [Gammaproteobacteria bacterium]|nr:phage holin family protein [Gammaproteobacteria bacterium]
MFDSPRRLLAQLLTLIQARLEMISAEISAEIQRVLRSVLWTLLALLFAALGLLMAALTLVIALWEYDRLLVSLWVKGGFLTVVAISVFMVSRTLTKESRLFSRTIDELRCDRDAIAQRRSSTHD